MHKDIFPQGRTIEENLSILLEEIKLAAQWNRPSILLVIYKSKFGQVKLQRALESKLKELGQNCVYVEVRREQPNPLPLLLKTPHKEGVVFFVSNLERGGPEAYQAINLYREVFIENQIRMVLWLTPNEATKLPHQAPDFWAFRHKTVEFSRRQAPRKFHLPAGLLIWPVEDHQISFKGLHEQIKAREKLLADLPPNIESTSTRAELLSVLGFLHWAAGGSSDAMHAFEEGLRITKGRNLPASECVLLNGRAILLYEDRKYAEAIEAYQKALEKNPQNSDVLMNLSIAYCAIGQKEKAISLAKRATDMNPKSAKLWHGLGYIYDSMGRSEEAYSCFSQASRLAPKDAEYHVSLAVYYTDTDDQEKATREIRLAREFAGESSHSLHVVEAAITGNIDTALDLLKQAIQKQQVSRLEAERSPIMNKLLDLSQI